MKHLAYRLLLNVLALFAVDVLLGDEVNLKGLTGLLVVVLLLAAAQALIRPLLFLLKLVTAPANWLTLGGLGFLFSLMLNAIAFFAIGLSGLLGESFQVESFVAALKATVLLSVISTIGSIFIGQKQKE